MPGELQGKPEANLNTGVKDNRAHKFWRAPLDFAVHSVIGTCIFAIVGAPAILIQFVVLQLESHTFRPLNLSLLMASSDAAPKLVIDGPIIFGLKAAEYALFSTDLLLFGVFLYRAARRAINQL